jgi:hypothetical protein
VINDVDVEGNHRVFTLIAFGVPIILLVAPILHEDVHDSTFCGLLGVRPIEFPSGFVFTFFEYFLCFWVCNTISFVLYCKVFSFVRIYYKDSIEEKLIHQQMATKIMIYPGLNLLLGLFISASIIITYATKKDQFAFRVLLIVCDHIEPLLSATVYGINDNISDILKRKFRRFLCKRCRGRAVLKNNNTSNSWIRDENLLSDDYESILGDTNYQNLSKYQLLQNRL